MKLPVDISLAAVQEVRAIMENKGIPENYMLRIGVKEASGCAGVNYQLGFDEETSSDQVFAHEGLKILVAKKDFMHLLGVEVDYISDSEVSGFVFKNE